MTYSSSTAQAYIQHHIRVLSTITDTKLITTEMSRALTTLNKLRHIGKVDVDEYDEAIAAFRSATDISRKAILEGVPEPTTHRP